jgi:steroid 5-alpha reductase family enzyme
MTPLSLTLLSTAVVVTLALVALWLLSLVLRDASIVDPFWGLGFVGVAWLSLALNGATPRVALLVALTTLWGLRLSLYLLWRNWGTGEDRRYAAMRAKIGPRFWWLSLFIVFLLQAAILWFVSLPVQIASVQRTAASLGWLDLLGLLLWCCGFFFESVGDWQLARFKRNPANAGQVMDQGLWRYTRHPNYFGDCCVWWGLYLIAAAGGAGWTVASTMLMTLLLMRISGVTLLERTLVDRRPDYAAYQRRTNAFFPGPPRDRFASNAPT